MKVIDTSQCIVIKIGSSLLADSGCLEFRTHWFHTLIEDIEALFQEGKRIVVVSSGAVLLGRKCMNLGIDELKLEEKQAAAACGQAVLMGHYQKAIMEYGRHAGQILLTIHDLERRRNYLNAKNTIETLLSMNALPVVNENDTVTTSELRVGDNDRLAARVAQMLAADVMLVLSDVHGLYTVDPSLSDQAEHLDYVEHIDPSIESMANDAINPVSSGGMATKIEAAKMVTASGCHMVLGRGVDMHPIQNLRNGAPHTLFQASETPVSARRRWISGHLNPKGSVIVDDGALEALRSGKSLLPAGVIDVDGDFSRGDAVVLKDCRMHRIGVGLVAYDVRDARLIMGHQSDDIQHIKRFKGREEMVHRNDMFLERSS